NPTWVIQGKVLFILVKGPPGSSGECGSHHVLSFALKTRRFDMTSVKLEHAFLTTMRAKDLSLVLSKNVGLLHLSRRVVTSLMTSCLAWWASAAAGEANPPTNVSSGTVDFPISCSQQAQ